MHLPWTVLVHCRNSNNIILAIHLLLIYFVSYQIRCRAICNKALLTNHYNQFGQKQWLIIPYTKCMAFWQAQFWCWDSDLLWLRFNCTCSLIFLNLQLLIFAHFLLTISVCLGGLWERSWCSLTSWSHQTWTVAQRVQGEERWLWTRQENVSSWKGENFDHEWKKLLNPFYISL